MHASLAAFAVAALVLTLTPGLDTALVLRTAAADGPRAAFGAALGIALGCLVWGAAGAFGISALLTASTLAYAALRWGGAIYLLWVGGKMLLRPRTELAGAPERPSSESPHVRLSRPHEDVGTPHVRLSRPHEDVGTPHVRLSRPHEDVGTPCRRGLLTNLLNPKVGLFYVSFLPQFIPADSNAATFALLLVGIHVGMGLAWFAILIAAMRPIARVLRRPDVIRWLDRATGGLFIAFGIRLATDR